MVQIIAISDGYAHFAFPIEEYQKRLRNTANVRLIAGEKSKNPSEIVKKESQKLKALLEKEKGYVIYCDITGEMMDTKKFTEMLSKIRITSPKTIFLIGGAYGVDMDMLAPYIQKRISFSPMTLPHSLALLVLLEQVYRAWQIESNTGYHH